MPRSDLPTRYPRVLVLHLPPAAHQISTWPSSFRAKSASARTSEARPTLHARPCGKEMGSGPWANRAGHRRGPSDFPCSNAVLHQNMLRYNAVPKQNKRPSLP